MDTAETFKVDSHRILSKLVASIGGYSIVESSNHSSITIPVNPMKVDPRSVFIMCEKVGNGSIRVPIEYHKMIIEAWSEELIGATVESCGFAILPSKVAELLKMSTCKFILSNDINKTRIILFEYDGSINYITGFYWSRHLGPQSICMEGDPSDLLSLFTNQCFEQFFGLAWSILTGVPEKTNEKEPSNTIKANRFMGFKNNR